MFAVYIAGVWSFFVIKWRSDRVLRYSQIQGAQTARDLSLILGIAPKMLSVKKTMYEFINT